MSESKDNQSFAGSIDDSLTVGSLSQLHEEGSLALTVEGEDGEMITDEEHERRKAEALQRQLEMREKVKDSRDFVDALKADDNIIDGRTRHTNCIERIHRYNYDNGNLKLSFVSAPGLLVRPVEVFRETYTTDENIEVLNNLMYEANVERRELDEEELRLVLNDDYTEMKASAEEELLYRGKSPPPAFTR
jgi:hypothetical protein